MKSGTVAKRRRTLRRTKEPSDDARPKVLAVFQAVHKSTASMDAFAVVEDPERNGAAIMLAAYRGWLRGRGSGCPRSSKTWQSNSSIGPKAAGEGWLCLAGSF